jgi:bacillithiol biosynthesis cysteine-adding enzyme BshC
MGYSRRQKKQTMSSLDPHHFLKGLPLDYLAHDSRILSYFSRDYHSIQAERGEISGEVLKKIREYNAHLGAPSLVFEAIERLTHAPAVITGQQPCLLTGPLFVIYKALTAIILAERHDAVPIFWNASEDDDISEVNHIWVIDGGLEKVTLNLDPSPFFQVTLTQHHRDLLITKLEELTPATEFRENVLSLIKGCSSGFSEMFSQLLTALFSDYGLVMVEPHLFSGFATPLFEQLIRHPTKAVELITRAGDSLETTGYRRQIHKPPDSCSFYLTPGTARVPVTYDGIFHAGESTYSEPELLALLEKHPDWFSSTVISRPLIQDFLLPTLAYCAGPGEISYFAQMKDVYTFFGVQQPYIVPRFGATLLEPKVLRVLEKYEIRVPHLFNADQTKKVLARQDIGEVFTMQNQRISDIVKELEKYMSSIDPNLEKAGAAARTRIAHEIRTLEDKTATAVKTQSTIMERQITKASENVYPNKSLQERVLNVMQYLIRYDSLLDRVYEHLREAHPGDHVLINLGE